MEYLVASSIIAKNMKDALDDIKKSDIIADVNEIRFDCIKDYDIDKILKYSINPVIFTNRDENEGGYFKGTESERFSPLIQGLQKRVAFVDVELEQIEELTINKIKKYKTPETKLIISYHEIKDNLTLDQIEKIYSKAKEYDPDIIKIVYKGIELNDSYNIINFAKHNKDLVGFCLGDKFNISRYLSPIVGYPLAYGCLDESKCAAPGQIPVQRLKIGIKSLSLLERIKDISYEEIEVYSKMIK